MHTWLEGNSGEMKNAQSRNLTPYHATENCTIIMHSIVQWNEKSVLLLYKLSGLYRVITNFVTLQLSSLIQEARTDWYSGKVLYQYLLFGRVLLQNLAKSEDFLIETFVIFLSPSRKSVGYFSRPLSFKKMKRNKQFKSKKMRGLTNSIFTKFSTIQRHTVQHIDSIGCVSKHIIGVNWNRESLILFFVKLLILARDGGGKFEAKS
jgi:hypothetical protein